MRKGFIDNTEFIATFRTYIATTPARMLKKDIDESSYIPNNMATKIVYRNFKVIRSLAGFSPSQIALAFDVTKQVVSRWDNGKYTPSVTLSMAFMEFIRYNVRASEYRCDDGNPIFIKKFDIEDDEKVKLLFPIALKCLDKAFQIGNEGYDIDKDLVFLSKLMDLDIDLIKELIDRGLNL